MGTIWVSKSTAPASKVTIRRPDEVMAHSLQGRFLVVFLWSAAIYFAALVSRVSGRARRQKPRNKRKRRNRSPHSTAETALSLPAPVLLFVLVFLLAPVLRLRLAAI